MPARADDPRAVAGSVLHDLCGERPLSRALLIRRLYTAHGHRLKVHAWPITEGELPATRITVAGADHVFYPRDTSEPHRQHILLREMAARALTDQSPHGSLAYHPVHELFPSMPPQVVSCVLPELPQPPDALVVEHLATLMASHLVPQQVATGKAMATLEPLRYAITRGIAPTISPRSRAEYLYRQVIEINDAMWRLRRHLTHQTRERARRLVQHSSLRGNQAEAVCAAFEWQMALIAERRGAVPTEALALPPGGATFEREVDRLLMISHAFHGLPRSSAGVRLRQGAIARQEEAGSHSLGFPVRNCR